MFYRPSPVVTVVLGAAFFAYQAGEKLRYLEPPRGQIISIATAGSTASISSVVIFNPTTFAKIETPPEVPPNLTFEQT